MVRIGGIVLDNTNPRWFTCCGKFHCKAALSMITIFFFFIEVMEWYAYVARDDIGHKTDWQTALISLIQLASIILLVISFFNENQYFLLLFMLFLFMTLTSFALWSVRCFVWLIYPYSNDVEDLLGFNETTSWFTREKYILTFLAFITSFLTLTYWFLTVTMSCYMYYESRANAKKVAQSAETVNRPPMVSGDVESFPVPQSTRNSFPNENFSISDDEDGDDKVFEKKEGPQMV